MIWLADGNLLIAHLINTHADHARAKAWFDSLTDRFATCAVTQGTLLRMHMRLAADTSARAAWKALEGIEAHPLHDYWDDDLPYRKVDTAGLSGHRQVTDAWLAELARRYGAKLATLDQGLAIAQSDVAVLIP